MSEIIVPKKVYFISWAWLLALLALTVGVAYKHLGWLNPVVAVSIATIKATIIVMYFMHARYSPRLITVFVAAGVLWLTVLFAFAFSDYLTRSYLPRPAIWDSNHGSTGALR